MARNLSGKVPTALLDGSALYDFRFADKDWHRPHPTLARWYATFAERPSMQASQPH